MPMKPEGPDQQVPDTYEKVVAIISRDYPALSPGFQQIARFVTQNPNVVALESINAVAAQCGVNPSSLVRFAQHFGYSGFKPFQAVFQTRLATAAPGLRERVSALGSELSRPNRSSDPAYLRDLVVRDIAALQGLLDSVSQATLAEAAQLLTRAETIFIAGQLRSEPIASFLRYLLTMLHLRVVLLDPAGGLAQEMATTMTSRDVVVAIAFRHYAAEVVAVAEMAAAKQVPIVSITDSLLSPLAKDAGILFTVPEEEYSFSRSLAAPMCLVQGIAVATAAVLQHSPDGGPRIPTVTGIVRDRLSNRDARRPTTPARPGRPPV